MIYVRIIVKIRTIEDHMYVSVRNSAYWSVQEGICPMMEKETAGFPFFVFSYEAARIQKLHFCVGNLSSWDASLDNKETRNFIQAQLDWA